MSKLNPQILSSLTINALYNLGLFYDADDDKTKVFEYMKRAADLGDADAQIRIGYMYEKGIGVEQNYEKAVENYKKGAEQGSDYGFFNLGVLSLEGHGLKQSYENGIIYMSQSALMGHDLGFWGLGELYRDGEGVKKDNNMAADFFHKAAEMGNEEAQKSYDDMVSDGRIPKDYKPSEPSLKMDPDELCDRGLQAVEEEDYDTAYTCFLCAAEEGSARGQYDLGIMYANAVGLEQSTEKAEKYFTLAADQGDEDARKALKELEALQNK